MIRLSPFPVAQILLAVWLFAMPPKSIGQDNAATKREPVGQTIVNWISKARDEVQLELESIQSRYEEWKSKESPLGWELNRGDRAKAENHRLSKIDDQITVMENQIRDLEMEQKLIEMKSRLIHERVQELRVRKKKQQAVMQELAKSFRIDEHFRSEIKRHKAMHEEITKKLADIDLLEVYGSQEK